MLIYLIGMPASGKSTFGKKVAKELNYDFLDLDILIEQRNKTTIPYIFEQKGEDFFRKEEQKALQTTFTLEKTVIATGGGTPCFFDNLENMKEKGVTCLLNTEISNLVKRTFQAQQIQQNHRPLFKTANSLESLYKIIEQKWKNRKKYYKQAHFEVENNDLEEFLGKLSDR